MFYAYLLKSLRDGIFYYGSTKDLASRLREHNYGHVKSTKGHRPYKIHYFEIFDSMRDSRKRELFFNTIDGYNWLEE